MPELPEVETVVRNLRGPLVGRTIRGMWYDWARTIQTPDPVSFADRITGQTVEAINRRAKYIICALTHDLLVVHLKMTGRLYVTDANAVHDADRWVHFRLDLDGNQQLRFSDSRKFGRVYLTSDFADISPTLGPEPLAEGFTLAVFQERMARRKKNIKALLLDQSFVAGVGNIYADEALFRAGVNPLRRSEDLQADEIRRLHQTIQDALHAGIQHEGASINWYRKPDGTKGNSQDHFYVYGRDGQPCKKCDTLIQKIRVAQRGTHYCPICQPLT
jgi:formamidopyrimidine-DNA glycosylase